MAETFVLIHSPRVGPMTWRPVSAALRARGLAAIVPELRLGAGPLWRGYLGQVASAVEAAAAAGRLCLVGHSAAGLLLTQAAAAIGWSRVGALVWADASRLRPGGTLFDTFSAIEEAEMRALAADGLLPVWGAEFSPEAWSTLIADDALRGRFRGEIEPTPLRLFDEVFADAVVPEDVRCAYLRFSVFYADEQARAAALGWRTRHIAGQHLHMLVDPEAVVEALIDLAR